MDHSFTVYGNKNCTYTVEINLMVSYEIKHVTQQLHFWTFMSEKLKIHGLFLIESARVIAKSEPVSVAGGRELLIGKACITYSPLEYGVGSAPVEPRR